MYKHTEVAERLGFSRQALDKHRKQLEQRLGHEVGSIQGNARVYSASELQQLREQLPESKQACIDRILGAIEVSSTPASVEVMPSVSSKDFIASFKPEMPTMRTFQYVDTSDEVSEIDAELDQLLKASKSADQNIFKQLALQAVARGRQTGKTLAQLEIAAIENERHQAIQNLAKKHDLKAESEAS